MPTEQRPGRAPTARPGRCRWPARRATAAAAVAVLAAGCRPGTAPTAPPAPAAPAEAPLPADVAAALSAPTTVPRAAAPGAPHPFRLRPVAAPPDGAAPLAFGAWAPDGRHVIAFTHEPGGVGVDLGRLWIVDAGPPAAVGAPTGGDAAADPTWALDSGDVVGAPGRDALAAWRADGRLVVARTPDTLIDLGRAAPPPFADVAPRSVAIAPDGVTVLAVATERTWLIDGTGAARPVAGLPAGLPADAFAWRVDGVAAAAVDARGGVWVVATAEATARQVSQLTWAGETGAAGTAEAADAADVGDIAESSDGSGGAAAERRPTWLADGRLLVPRPVRLPTAGAPIDLALVDAASGAVDGLLARAGLPPPPALPNGRALAAPNGRWVIAPLVVPEAGRPALGGARLVAVDGSGWRDLPPLADPHWAHDGAALVALEAGAVTWIEAATGRQLRRLEGGARRLWWSPDSRRLAVMLDDGALAIVDADGARGPTRVASGVDGRWPPVWSADGRRIALATRPTDGPPALVIVDLAAP